MRLSGSGCGAAGWGAYFLRSEKIGVEADVSEASSPVSLESLLLIRTMFLTARTTSMISLSDADGDRSDNHCEQAPGEGSRHTYRNRNRIFPGSRVENGKGGREDVEGFGFFSMMRLRKSHTLTRNLTKAFDLICLFWKG